MTERAPQDRCRLPAPSWCDGGRALSGALHTGAQACAAELAQRRLPSTSFMPRPNSPLTASSDDSTRTTEPKTPQSPGRNHQHEDRPTLTKKAPPRRQDQDWHPASLYLSVPTPRSSLFIAPPHFQLLQEASRKGALPSRPLPSRREGAERIITWPKSREIHSPKMRPLLHMTFDPHRPSSTPKRGKNRREKAGGKKQA